MEGDDNDGDAKDGGTCFFKNPGLEKYFHGPPTYQFCDKDILSLVELNVSGSITSEIFVDTL